MRRFAWRRTVCTMAVAVPLLLSVAATTGAAVSGQEHFAGTDSFTDTECGFPFDVESTFRGHAHVRSTPGGEAFLQHLNVSFRDVWTNRETGRSFVLRGRSVIQEIRATQVEGNLYELEAVEAGQPFVIEDASGRVVVRDRGVIRHTFLFDTLGDGMPGGEFLEGTTVAHGPHPGFADDFPFCEIAAELTGA